MSEAERADVLVLGGGPGGSTVGGLLAERGLRVVLVEKERHPRFHVGESLLPYNARLFQRLGVWERMGAAGFQRKWGATFAFEPGDAAVRLDFSRGLDPRWPMSFQVRRAELDHLLLRRAGELGVDVREEETAERVLFDGERAVGARIRRKDGETYEVRARLVVDATGRDTLLAGQMRSKKRDGALRQAALFCHWKGARMGIGREGGDILIVGGEWGWFWLIPLDAETTSVGVVFPGSVMRQRGGADLESFYRELIGRSTIVSERLKDATLMGDVNPLADFSYRAERFTGDGWALVGDAAAFLDPVFSSGLYLAMRSAEKLADEVGPRLVRGRSVDARALAGFERFARRGLDRFRRYIVAFYDPACSSLFRNQPPPLLRAATISAFAGKVFERDPRIWLFDTLFFFQSARIRRLAEAGQIVLPSAPACDARWAPEGGFVEDGETASSSAPPSAA